MKDMVTYIEWINHFIHKNVEKGFQRPILKAFCVFVYEKVILFLTFKGNVTCALK